MKGLLFKDYYSMRSSLKMMGLVLLIYIPISCYLKNNLTILLVVFLFLLNMILNVFAADEQSGWQKMALSMPLKRSRVVLERYCFVVIGDLTAIGISMAGSVLVDRFLDIQKNSPSDAFRMEGTEMTVMLTSYLAGVIVLAFAAILIPIIYQLGAEKGRYAMLLIYLLPLLLFYVLSKTMDPAGMNGLINRGIELVKWFGIPGIMILLSVSYRLSVSIYKKKEW